MPQAPAGSQVHVQLGVADDETHATVMLTSADGGLDGAIDALHGYVMPGLDVTVSSDPHSVLVELRALITVAGEPAAARVSG